MEKNNFPNNWVCSQISDVSKLIRGVTYKKSDSTKIKKNNYVGILRGTNIQSKLILEDLVYVPKENLKNEQYVKKNDVIITMSSGSKHLVGKSSQSKNNLDISFGTFCACLRPSKLINGKYFGYFFKSDLYNKSIQSRSLGVNINNLRRGHVESLEFPTPPLNEQKRIAEKIKELFSLSQKIKQSILETKIFHDSLISSLYKFALNGSLTKLWRENNYSQPASITIIKNQLIREQNYSKICFESLKNNQKKPRKPTCLDEKFNKILIKYSKIPETWAYSTLNQLSSIQPRSIQSGPFGSSLHHNEFQKNGFLVIGIDNVHNNEFRLGSEHRISKEKFSELERYRARPNDLLITVMGAIGRTCLVPNDIEPSIITKHIYRISLDENLCNPEYVLLCMLGSKSVSAFFKKEQRGMTMPGLNGSIIKHSPIPLPPKEEQLLIVEIFKTIFSHSRDFKNIIQICEQKLYFFEKSILNQAFTGKLVPQDPNDEPASELLKRIKLEN